VSIKFLREDKPQQTLSTADLATLLSNEILN